MVTRTSTRRRIIAVGLASALPVVSGCSALSKGESGAELGQVTVENSDDATHTIHVAIERDSELIYGASRELEAISAPEDDDFGSVDGSILENSAWDETTGTWAVYTRVDDQTSWKRHEIPTDSETTCHSVRLTIEDDSSVTGFTPDCASWPPGGDTEATAFE